ncbi:tetratricopeptide repeat protein [Pseudooceanicola algae]|uniref:tetratricopeptide repeat protein n=1 Tax=Pseudooceanicola algae TaxID=1537215 RepID=UPI001E46FC76|nr:tetratricopeptide repeat protein [Pseudooceanicola algae]
MLYRNFVLAACAAASLLASTGGGLAQGSGQAPATEPEIALMDALADAEPVEARRIVRELGMIWSRSGSPTMDLLLRQGKDALEAGDLPAAVGHLSALIDHAPDFAEGWHLRAQAFFQQEELGLALSDLENAVALNPRNFQAVYGMALILEQTGRVEAAFAGYSAILAIYPAHEEALAGRDRLARGLGGSDI